jgi:hypothetical protein
MTIIINMIYNKAKVRNGNRSERNRMRGHAMESFGSRQG